MSSTLDEHDPKPTRPALDCTIDLDCSDRVNFAMQQNGVPLVESVRVASRADAPLHDLTVELSLENDGAEPWTGRLALIGPGDTAVLNPTGFRLNARSLALRTEGERSSVNCRVSCDTGAVRAAFPLDILAFDEWPGVGHFPELTAAFVTPNHPRVADLLGAARVSLRNAGQPEALDGYASGSRQRVSRIAEACFNAVSSLGVGYITAPASFETTGQRVRLADRIMRERLGNCLDLSLLLMSLWEQCGLHPVLLLPERHAMPAVWTHETHLPEAAIDEPARIRNLIELGELIPVEATHCTHADATYERAVDSAKGQMDQPGELFCAIDIRAARARGIRPLPLRDDGESGVDLDALAPDPARPATSTLDPVALAERAERRPGPDTSTNTADSGSDRIARWQRRLLDLSLRNRLLNFRETGRTLRLLIPDLCALEDMLAEGDRVTVSPRSETDPAFLAEELRSHRVYADLGEAEAQKRLLTLYRTARSSIEETGANLLHLALGQLKWYESTSADEPRLAPLILLPVTLTRTATGAGYAYSLRLSEEPLRPNITLLEKLRTEFGIDTTGLDDLPEGESGLDVPLILRNFRSAIRDSSRWEVVEAAHLGLFSFNKFLMWRDLQDNLDRLRTSELVRYLVDQPDHAFDDQPFPRTDSLDADLAPEDLLCTRNADSSQLAAVKAAADGRTFVLEGPPGTGKSQTIANIIADGLAHGRRVLFVAEKMAALSVVRKRLEQDGLGPFCLELHSAKASKKEVLAQLEEALHANGGREPPEWSDVCRNLGATRTQLNAYVDEMHRPRETGESLYRVLGRLSFLGEGPSAAPPTDAPESVTKEELDNWRRLIADLIARATPVDPPSQHPLRGIGSVVWSFTLPDEARRVLGAGTVSLTNFGRSLEALIGTADPDVHRLRIARESIGALAGIASLMDACPYPTPRLTYGPTSSAGRESLARTVALGGECDALRTGLLDRYHEEFLDLDHLVHTDAVKRVLGHPRLIRLFTARSVRNQLRAYCKGSLPPLEEVHADLTRARELKRSRAALLAHTEAPELLGALWQGTETDWKASQSLLEWADSCATALRTLDADPGANGIAPRLARAVSDPGAAHKLEVAAGAVVESQRAWETAWRAIEETLATDALRAGAHDADDWLGAMHATLERWRTSLGDLNSWCAWRTARDAASDAGLSGLVELYESSECSLDEMDSAFWRGFGRAWFSAVADSVDAVRAFNASAHTDAISRFRALDEALIALTRDVVATKLHASAPQTPAQVSSQSEVGILRRELEKKRRHLPTRRLIEAMPNLLPRLKPCFLMSPLSVAQFLETRLPPFDLVVFDEASQIPVWDAIGAIARGTGVIVVGDSKQLPPTSFFNTLDGDDESDDGMSSVDDVESILNECNASGIPAMRLRWHYRSRHETLIAFSNYHYYKNELHTFPSPAERSDQLGVSFHHVAEGVYDRGGSRTNRAEAERVVEEVVRLLRDPTSDDSIGIVTFNLSQQGLIEDLLDAKRREMPEIESHFTSEVREPVFVKNLENVQGDERDTIIFSVGFGADPAGRYSMNFGPLNKDGGERRLNVAVTRARRRLMVFSSMRADQIDLRRTGALGVRHFKAFLDYADRGPRALAEEATARGAHDFETGFERAVWRALREQGWEVDTQVGCAGYRIDLAVRHPDQPGRYTIGIECDGAAYHSAKTARDRDRIRESVLEGLGWTIARVWSTEWKVNPSGCLAKLQDAIEQSLHQPSEQPMPESTEVAPTAPQKPGAPPASPVGPFETTMGDDSRAASVYEPARVVPLPGAMDLYAPTTLPVLVLNLAEIVEAEAPIVADLAARRLAESVGLQRLTARFRERFDEVLAACEHSGRFVRTGDCLWRRDDDPATFSTFRRPSDDPRSRRDVEEVPLVELQNASLAVLRAQFGLPRDELVRETSRAFGMQRVTSRVSDRIGEAISRLVDDGEVIQDDAGQVSLGTPD